MFTQYFGNFLFETKVITRAQFIDALSQLGSKRAKLGILAIESGLMTPADVEDVHNMQLRVDKRFGELAVEHAYLTEEQLQTLLGRQSNPFAVFSQIMCDTGLMTYAQLSDQMERYRAHCGMSAESFARFKDDQVSPLMGNLLADTQMEETRKKTVELYMEVFMKNISRFISANSMITGIDTTGTIHGNWVSAQKIIGSHEMNTAFTGDEAVMLYIASCFSKKDFAALDDVSRDVLGEFLNCNNGIFTANMIEYKMDLDMEPQAVSQDTGIIRSDDMLTVLLNIEQYALEVHLAF